jgi:hypothetical protein
MTRATHQLLHGDVIGALHFNLLLPLALALIVLGWISWVTGAAGREVATLARVPRSAYAVAIAVAVGFGVVRNIPGVDGLRG